MRIIRLIHKIIAIACIPALCLVCALATDYFSSVFNFFVVAGVCIYCTNYVIRHCSECGTRLRPKDRYTSNHRIEISKNLNSDSYTAREKCDLHESDFRCPNANCSRYNGKTGY